MHDAFGKGIEKNFTVELGVDNDSSSIVEAYKNARGLYDGYYSK